MGYKGNMDNELMIRVEALATVFLAAQKGEPEAAERFLSLNAELYTWAEKHGIDAWDVHHAINEVGERNPPPIGE